MPHNYRVTFFFESQQGALVGTGAALGWTESWYKGGVEKSLQLEIINPEFKEYIKKRTAFMPNLYRCSFIRLSDDDNPRRFKVAGIGGSEGVGKLDSAVFNAAQVQCAILVDLEKMPQADNEKAHHRRFLVRALPNSLINGNVLRPSGQAYTDLRAFLDYVGGVDVMYPHDPAAATFTYGIRYHNPANLPVKIDEVHPDLADPQRLLLKFPGMGVLLPGVKVRITRVPHPKNFNRTWNFSGMKPPENTYGVLERSRTPLDGSYTGPGQAEATVVSWLYGTIDQYVLIGLRNKKTGRSFHLLRGRSSRRT